MVILSKDNFYKNWFRIADFDYLHYQFGKIFILCDLYHRLVFKGMIYFIYEI